MSLIEYVGPTGSGKTTEVISILKHLLELKKIEQTQTNKFQIKCP